MKKIISWLKENVNADFNDYCKSLENKKKLKKVLTRVN